MIRLTLALLATMFMTFVIAGQDRGQVRYGLMSPDIAAVTVTPQTLATASATAVDIQTADLVPVLYVPTRTLIVAPQDDAAAQPVLAEPTPPAPAEPEQLVLFISVASANVREGPSKDFAVIEKLSRGEAVSVISATEGPEGWTLIRIEGDGIEGYVSNALLTDAP